MKVEALRCPAQFESNVVPGCIRDGFEYTLFDKRMSMEPVDEGWSHLPVLCKTTSLR